MGSEIPKLKNLEEWVFDIHNDKEFTGIALQI